MHRFFRFCLLIAVTVTSLSAAIYNGNEVECRQPDGSTLMIRVWGDEFSLEAESLDGWTVIKGADRWWYVAKPAAGGGIEPSHLRFGAGDPATLGVAPHLRQSRAQRIASRDVRRRQFHRDERGRIDSPRMRQMRAARQAQPRAGMPMAAPGGPRRAPPAFPTVGTRHGVTLMIRFPDVAGTISQAAVDAFCNGDNYATAGNNGSVKEYFFDNSFGELTYTNTVVDYYTALHNKDYYTDPLHPERAVELVTEALDAADDGGFDFSTCDDDSDGVIDAVNAFYAGSTYAESTLWPHMDTLSWTSSGGMEATAYQISNMGSQLVLGAFCHENGHLLCDFPDLYDYGYDSGGVGKFCLMDTGSYGATAGKAAGTNPARICGYLALAAGWRVPTLLNGPPFHNQLFAEEGVWPFVAIVGIYQNMADPTEYFLVENRNRGSASGRDASLPSSGLAIWHCDEAGNNDLQNYSKDGTNNHYECALVQADNQHHLEKYANSGDSRDLWYRGNATAGYTNRFTDGSGAILTTNNARWWDNSASGLIISQISAAGTTMQFWCGQPFLALESATYTVAEGNSGTSHATIGVYRTGDSAGAIAMTWTLADGTATLADLDYQAASGTVNWKDGEVGLKYIQVPIKGDTRLEADETIQIDIASVTPGIFIGWSTAVLTITNDDVMPTQGSIELVSYLGSATEGGALVVQVQRVGSGAPGSCSDPVSVPWTITSGTAVAGTDFTMPGDTLTWGAGETGIKTVTIATTVDALPEDDETFTFVLGTATGGAIAPTPNVLTATILNDDYSVGFGSSLFRYYEPVTGTVSMPVPLTHSGAIHGTFTVDYHIVAGTATPGDDYTVVAGTLTWDTSTTAEPSIMLPVLADLFKEGIETLSIVLDTPVNTVLEAQDTITIEISDPSSQNVSDALSGTAGTSWANGSGCGTGTSALLLGLSLVGLGFFPRRRRQR